MTVANEMVSGIDVWQVILTVIDACIVVIILAILIWYTVVRSPSDNKNIHADHLAISNRLALMQHRIDQRQHYFDISDAFWMMAVMALREAFENKPRSEWPFPEGSIDDFYDMYYIHDGEERHPNVDSITGDDVAEASTLDWASILVPEKGSSFQLLVYYNSISKTWIFCQIENSDSDAVVYDIQRYTFDVAGPVQKEDTMNSVHSIESERNKHGGIRPDETSND